ncbi:MAG: glycosyltransferase family 39 protein [Bacteroidia bacterium]|nr:glycosyltransferase family 39 protein [Bacteroidia bacterium]
MKNRLSFISLLLSYLLIGFFSFIYYPKYNAQEAEATIGWDVSGYYMYLPAIFIYHDLDQVEFRDDIVEKYAPTPSFEQAYKYENGNYIMKYSMGQGIMFTPFFLLGHAYASLSSYPADGFSLPYQFAIFFGSFLMALLGLWLIRKFMLRYFSDQATAIAIFLVVFGSNYMDYASMNAAMTHSYLFTVYAGLLWLSLRFYESPSFGRAAGIGLLVGLAALTRPTEIVSVLIPVLWGIKFPLKSFILDRFNFVKDHFGKYLLAGLLTGLVGSLQLIYWKTIGGHWLIYSYQDQGFSWLSPHIWDCLFSFRAGWFIYSPIMAFSLLGFIPMARNQKEIFGVSLIFSFIFMYITFAWDIWWYGGSLGQRAMVQAYAVLLLPVASLVQWINQRKYLPYLFYAVAAVCIYHNFWITHQAHKGGLFIPEQMNQAYFKGILWKSKKSTDPSVRLYLDNEDMYLGEPKNITGFATNDFEADTSLSKSPYPAISGNYSYWVDGSKEHSPAWELAFSNVDKDYLRLSADIYCESKKAQWWRMPQVVLELYREDELVRRGILRPFRHIDAGKTTRVDVDLKLPRQNYNKVKVYLWNGQGDKPMLMDNAKLLLFDG